MVELVLGIAVLTVAAALFLIPLIHHRLALSFSILFIAAGAPSLYYWLGGYNQLAAYPVMETDKADVKRQLNENPEPVIRQVNRYVKQHPGSQRAWLLLGKLNLAAHRSKDALRALSRAYQIKPDNTAAQLMYARAFYAYHGCLDEHTHKMVTDLLTHHPEAVSGWHLLALEAYNQQNYHSAVHYWRRMLPYLPKNSRQKQIVLKEIKAAKHYLVHEPN